MNPSLSIRHQACPNKKCAHYNQPLRGNVVLHGHQRPRLKCKACGATWAAHRKEVHYGLRTPVEKIKGALELLSQGLSIRKTARRIKVSPSAVHRWKKRMNNL